MQGTDYSHYRIDKPAGSEPDSAYLQQIVSPGHPDTTNVPYRGIVTTDGWKLVCVENFTWMLFNLNEDPYEEANQAQNNLFRAERKRLLNRLRQWIADTKDNFPVPTE